VETYGAEEAFVTGTFGGLTPVAEIDGRGYAVPGPLTARLRTLYEALVAAECA
ncbi:MAG TPA: aminotransferase class IV, partial [Thermohalobaculum sp.]|nr:aminotransferase class IV [Thermohalobaculum sp.]